MNTVLQLPPSPAPEFQVSINKTVWLSTMMALFFFFIMGIPGAMAFQKVRPLFLQLFSAKNRVLTLPLLLSRSTWLARPPTSVRTRPWVAARSR